MVYSYLIFEVIEMKVFYIEVKPSHSSVKAELWNGTPEGREAHVIPVRAKSLKSALSQAKRKHILA